MTVPHHTVRAWANAAPDATRVAFFVPGTPVGQGRISHGSHGRGYHSNGKTLKPWRALVAGHAPTRTPLLDGPLLLRVTFWMPRPKTVTRDAPTVPPDLSHLVRAVEDSLTGVVWKDDARVVRCEADKRYADGAQMSGADVEVVAL